MIHEIVDNIYLGNWKDAIECEEYNSDFIIFTVADDSKYISKKHFYKLIDGGSDIDEPTKVEFLRALNDLIIIRDINPKEQKVLVHCIQGISRSPSIVAAYIIKKYNTKADDSLRYIKSIRQEVNPAQKFIKMLNCIETGDFIMTENRTPSNKETTQDKQPIEKLKKFHYYLLPELSKLKNNGDAKSFLSRTKSKDLSRLGISTSSSELTKQFNAIEATSKYLNSLSYYEIVVLAYILSKKWRRNNVYDNLMNIENQKWEEKDISINDIYISFAEHSTKQVFRKHNFKLIDIVKDPNLWIHEPYSKLYKGRKVEFPICLAKKIDNSKYFIFDGTHRAIQMALNNQEYISLYCVEINDQPTVNSSI